MDGSTLELRGRNKFDPCQVYKKRKQKKTPSQVGYRKVAFSVLHSKDKGIIIRKQIIVRQKLTKADVFVKKYYICKQMKSPKKEIKITIRVDVETKNTLQLLADNDKRKLSDFIRIKLEAFLEENVQKKS